MMVNEKEKKKNLKRRVRDEVDDLSGLADVVEALTLEADHVGISRASANGFERQRGDKGLGKSHRVHRKHNGVRSCCESDTQGSGRKKGSWRGTKKIGGSSQGKVLTVDGQRVITIIIRIGTVTSHKT